MPTQTPNLLFIATDHQRADSLGMIQCGIEVTPNLNHLAMQGTNFTRAYTTCPLCVPARTALATGLYPTRNGAVLNDWRGVSAGDHPVLHELLHRAGYEVGHIGIHHIRVRPDLRERVPFAAWADQGDYNRYAAEHSFSPVGGPEFRRAVFERQDNAFTEARYSNTKTAVWPHRLEDFKDSYFTAQGIEFLEKRRSKPFALFVYLWAPHPPLVVPEPFATRFAPEKVSLPPNVGVPAQGEPPSRRQGIAAQLAEGISREEWQQVWGAHLGLVNMADWLIGEMLRALHESGNADNTVIAFTTDHGDSLGQHAMYQKMEMYEQAVRIPLVIKMPGTQAAQVNTPVSHLDVMPTILDLLSLEYPQNLDGLSLAHTIRTGCPPEERPVFIQYSGNPSVGDIRRAVVSSSFKYIYDPRDVPELYDLEEDPLEMTNVAGTKKYSDVVDELHQQCRVWGEAHGDWVEF